MSRCRRPHAYQAVPWGQKGQISVVSWSVEPPIGQSTRTRGTASKPTSCRCPPGRRPGRSPDCRSRLRFPPPFRCHCQLRSQCRPRRWPCRFQSQCRSRRWPCWSQCRPRRWPCRFQSQCRSRRWRCQSRAGGGAGPGRWRCRCRCRCQCRSRRWRCRSRSRCRCRPGAGASAAPDPVARAAPDPVCPSRSRSRCPSHSRSRCPSRSRSRCPSHSRSRCPSHSRSRCPSRSRSRCPSRSRSRCPSHSQRRGRPRVADHRSLTKPEWSSWWSAWSVSSDPSQPQSVESPSRPRSVRRSRSRRRSGWSLRSVVTNAWPQPYSRARRMSRCPKAARRRGNCRPRRYPCLPVPLEPLVPRPPDREGSWSSLYRNQERRSPPNGRRSLAAPDDPSRCSTPRSTAQLPRRPPRQ